jgi:hypothetical protein
MCSDTMMQVGIRGKVFLVNRVRVTSAATA